MYVLLEQKNDLVGIASLEGYQGGLKVFLEEPALDGGGVHDLSKLLLVHLNK